MFGVRILLGWCDKPVLISLFTQDLDDPGAVKQGWGPPERQRWTVRLSDRCLLTQPAADGYRFCVLHATWVSPTVLTTALSHSMKKCTQNCYIFHFSPVCVSLGEYKYDDTEYKEVTHPHFPTWGNICQDNQWKLLILAVICLLKENASLEIKSESSKRRRANFPRTLCIFNPIWIVSLSSSLSGEQRADY